MLPCITEITRDRFYGQFLIISQPISNEADHDAQEVSVSGSSSPPGVHLTTPLRFRWSSSSADASLLEKAADEML